MGAPNCGAMVSRCGFTDALGILCALAEAKGEIVSKDELMARLWPGRIVEEGNLHVHVSALRKSLDEHGEGHSVVITVPGRGYRLAGPTGLRSVQLAEGSLPPQLPLPDKPSIAVMPFANLSGDPGQEYFADGMVEEIITGPLASAGCSSWPAIRAPPTRAARLT